MDLKIDVVVKNVLFREFDEDELYNAIYDVILVTLGERPFIKIKRSKGTDLYKVLTDARHA